MRSLGAVISLLSVGAANSASPCFGGPDVGMGFSQVQDGKLNIVNAAPVEMWVHAEQNPTGAGGWSLERWRDTLSAHGFAYYWYQDHLPDGRPTAFNVDFKLDPYSDTGNLLDFAGASLRATAMLGCTRNSQDPTAGRAGLTCKVSSGGAPSPQTLFEWTIPGVMDTSFVDGYGVPMKVQSNNNDPRGDTVYGRMTPDLCPYKLHDSAGHYLGCQSPCSAGVGKDRSPNDPQSNDAACCAGAFNLPQTCNNGGIGGDAKNDKTREWCSDITKMCENDGQRVGYCFAYDDHAGTFSLGSKAKATFCADGFEWLSPGPHPSPVPSPTPGPSPSPTPGGRLEIRNPHSGRCLDLDSKGNFQDGTKLQLWDCSGWDGQVFEFHNGDIVNVHADKCLDIDTGGNYQDGTKVQLWTCAGTGNQKWEMHNGEIRSAVSGKCLDIDANGNYEDGTKIQIWDCSGWDGQLFQMLPAVSSDSFV